MDPAPPNSISFTPIHFTAGNSTQTSQLFYGLSLPLPPPSFQAQRPPSSLTFNSRLRNISFELYCQGCSTPSTLGIESAPKSSLWPLQGEISWDDLLTRGVRLDLAKEDFEDDEIQIVKKVEEYRLRIQLRRPPTLWVAYPEVQSGGGRGGRGRGRGGGGGPGGGGGRRPKKRRATEEDYIALRAESREDLEPASVLGLSGEKAFFKPGNWLTYEFTFALTPPSLLQLRSTLAALRAVNPLPLFYALPPNSLPRTISLPPNPTSSLSSIVPYPFPTRYLLEGLISYGVVTPDDLTILCACLRSRDGESLEMRNKLLVAMFAMGRISGRIKQVLDDLRTKLSSTRPTRNLNEHSVLVRRVIVTPTRILLSPPEQETSNHVLRSFPDQIDRFLRVQFADESEPLHFSEIWRDPRAPPVPPPTGRHSIGRGMLGRMKRILEDGLEFSGRRWTFLAAGGSQLKECQAWFICEDGMEFTAEKLRSWMGDFTKEKIVAKHCARISLCFSTTRAVPSPLVVSQTKDVTRGPYCFTDGVGLTSQNLVDAAALVLEGPNQDGRFSAVQVRIGGAKGMLAAWPHVTGNQVVLRPSMQKFESPHLKLGAMKMAKFAPAHLNRQVIMIMDSMGVDKNLLLRLFENQLLRVNQLTQRASTAGFIEELQVTSFPIQKLFRVGLGRDPFVRDTLKLVQMVLRWELKWKARIRIEKGVFLFGIADELGVLKENEVFCRFENPLDKNQAGVVQGSCLVYRSPALHPGDVQRVTAVAHPELIANAPFNCIIFSTKGKRDLPNQLSGGDLDGDVFSLIYDPELVRNARSASPMDYSAAPQPRVVPDVKPEHIRQWFLDFFTNDVLGALSVAHLAVADSGTVFDPACIELAKLASDAVDYTKSGIPVNFTSGLRAKAKRRPDYLGAFNPDNTYQSTGVLGTMFRMISDDPSFERAGVLLDPRLARLKVPLEFLIEATRLRREYEVDLVGAMRQYLLSEIELVTGLVAGLEVAVEKRRRMMKDDGLKVSIRDAFSTKMHRHYRSEANLFFLTQDIPPGFESAADAFAVAAYLIVNDPRARQAVFDEENEVVIIEPAQQNDFPQREETVVEEELVSFCWLWADELAEMLSRTERGELGAGRVKRERGRDETEEGRSGKGRGRIG